LDLSNVNTIGHLKHYAPTTVFSIHYSLFENARNNVDEDAAIRRWRL